MRIRLQNWHARMRARVLGFTHTELKEFENGPANPREVAGYFSLDVRACSDMV